MGSGEGGGCWSYVSYRHSCLGLSLGLDLGLGLEVLLIRGYCVLQQMEDMYGFSSEKNKNYEVRFRWCQLLVWSEYEPGVALALKFVTGLGRMKVYVVAMKSEITYFLLVST